MDLLSRLAMGARVLALCRRLDPVWQFVRPPQQLPPAKGRAVRLGQAVVALFVVAFVAFFTAYLFGQHDAFHTNAEDMGIMTQALWNTTHGAPLHQTICNIVSDTNCLGDVSRLAIHFEPIMFLVALLYALAPTPKTLQLVQVLAVALGAFPAYWIAVRRLGNVAAGVLFALVYLLYPSLDSAVTSDFHAVTLATPLLLFALYYLLTRNSAGFLIASLLALATKEEVALTIVMLGLYAVVIQGRRRFGGAVVLLALGWIVMEVAVMHALSPVGHSPMASRYAAFGSSPLSILWGVVSQPFVVMRNYLLDTSRVAYLGALLAPLAFLGLCSPGLVLLAVPALGINILSSNPTMYSGFAQYNAEIVPILLVATIDGAAKLSALGARVLPRLALGARVLPRLSVRVRCLAGNRITQGMATRVRPHLANVNHYADRTRVALLHRLRSAATVVARAATHHETLGGIARAGSVLSTRWGARRAAVRSSAAGARRSFVPRSARWQRMRGAARGIALGQVLLLGLALLPVGTDMHMQQRLGFLPVGRTFAWPQTTAHMRLADELIAQIPANASVSAQTDLVSHLSNRRFIYLFPYRALNADYVFVDVTGNTYPQMNVDEYAEEVRSVLASGQYAVAAATDGFLLLKRAAAGSASGDPAPLPASFYSFTQAAPNAIPNRVHGVSFDAGDAVVRLLGYDVSPAPNLYLTNPYLTVTTYWKVTGHLSASLIPEVVVSYPSGYTTSTTSAVTTQWLPMTSWPDGATMVVRSWPLGMPRAEVGAVRVGVRVRTVTDGSVDGALRLRPSHTISAGELTARDTTTDATQVPLGQAKVGEAGTLISFASEHVVP